MAISDGQIAMGMLQLVALSLPVFAIMTQVYFSMTEEKPSVFLGFVLLTGGSGLVISALLSAQFLMNQATSQFLSVSISLASLGIAAILPILYAIFDRSKDQIRNLRERSEEHIEIARKLSEQMEKYDVETVGELRETEANVPEARRDATTIEELREIQQSSEKSIEKLDKIERRFELSKLIKDSISAPRSLIHPVSVSAVLLIVAVYAFSEFAPISFGPISLLLFALLGWFLPTALEKIFS